jgi:hypothetical protein
VKGFGKTLADKRLAYAENHKNDFPTLPCIKSIATMVVCGSLISGSIAKLIELIIKGSADQDESNSVSPQNTSTPTSTSTTIPPFTPTSTPTIIPTPKLTPGQIPYSYKPQIAE